MIEQVIAWIVLAAFSPVVLVVMFCEPSNGSFWQDYKRAAVVILAMVAFFGCILALVWAVTVVFK